MLQDSLIVGTAVLQQLAVSPPTPKEKLPRGESEKEEQTSDVFDYEWCLLFCTLIKSHSV